ncbi:MAG TPA: hypothetical protein VFV58_22675 [Blastocatellia bacterium]|jgi:hypothetical protein|nr:hypothetical protein [Blastocatellia bacterium]
MFNRRFLYAALTSAIAILFSVNALAQPIDRSKTIKGIDSLKKEFIEKEKRFLSPSAEDQAKFAQFLKQPNTGLIRLFPSGLYDDVLLTPGGGSSYSFTRLTYDAIGAFDIAFRPLPKEKYDARPPIEEYRFTTPPQGLIVMLGDVPLEEVTIQRDGVKFLETVAPPSTKAEVHAEWLRAQNLEVTEKNGYEYKNYVPVIVNRTYALRSIVYSGKGNSDIMVAFRVVRKATDGSVVILWNLLEKFPAPSRPQ